MKFRAIRSKTDSSGFALVVTLWQHPGITLPHALLVADPTKRNLAFNWNYPVMYQNDWFNLSQTYTSMTPPGPSEIARWVFSDSSPAPVAYAQLVIKGLPVVIRRLYSSTCPTA